MSELDDSIDEPTDLEDPEPTREDLVNFISEFMTTSMNVNQVYRSNLVETIVGRVTHEFGEEGLCDLMLKIDESANWISDIVLDGPDLDEMMFKRHGSFDADLVTKARATEGLIELNRKIWRLRKKYSRIMVDEIFTNENETPAPQPAESDPDGIY